MYNQISLLKKVSRISLCVMAAILLTAFSPTEIHQKSSHALELLKTHAKAGYDVSSIIPKMKQVEIFGKVGNLNAAGNLLNEILSDFSALKEQGKNTSKKVSQTKISETKIKAPNKRVMIKGDIPENLAKNGIFDPSIEYVQEGKSTVGYMSFSSVKVPAHVSTLVAKTEDKGRTWHYLSSPNQAKPCTTHSGKNAICRYETSALVHVPGASYPWQLYAEKYPSYPPHKEEHNVHGDGVVEVRYAKNPQGPWIKSECLFGPKERNCRVDINRLHSDLKGMKFYNEIGIIYDQGILYMSLDASTTASGLGEWKKRKIILLSSRDKGRTWKYAGTLTDYNDANKLGYLVLTATSLVKIEDKIFLLASPSGAKGFFQKNRNHNGTYFIPFDDIRKGELSRDRGGNLMIAKYARGFDHFHGMSDFDVMNTGGGMVQGRLYIKDKKKEYFQLWQDY